MGTNENKGPKNSFLVFISKFLSQCNGSKQHGICEVICFPRTVEAFGVFWQRPNMRINEQTPDQADTVSFALDIGHLGLTLQLLLKNVRWTLAEKWPVVELRSGGLHAHHRHAPATQRVWLNALHEVRVDDRTQLADLVALVAYMRLAFNKHDVVGVPQCLGREHGVQGC